MDNDTIMPKVQYLSFNCICAFFKSHLFPVLYNLQFEELPKRRASEPVNPIYNIPRPIKMVQEWHIA